MRNSVSLVIAGSRGSGSGSHHQNCEKSGKGKYENTGDLQHQGAFENDPGCGKCVTANGASDNHQVGVQRMKATN